MYDALVESVRLIDNGDVGVPARLSRRRRQLPVAVDVDGDVAATAFLARCHGGARWDSWTLHRRDGVWTLRGGGGGSPCRYDELIHEPDIDRTGAHLMVTGGGSTLLSSGLFPDLFGTRYAHYAGLEVSTAVAAISVDARRRLLVPAHRRAVVVWRGRRPPVLRAHDADGRVIAEGTPDRPGLPSPWRRARGPQVSALVSRA